jgi:hypothetical protein
MSAWEAEGRSKTERAAGIVGEPLSPATLARIGAVKGFPAHGAGYRPEGPWVQAYRIFVCRGNVERGNEDVGCLRLERRPSGAGDSFKLIADQSVVHNEDTLHTLHAEMTCLRRPFAPLLEWRLTSRCRGASDALISDLSTDESGRVSNGVVELHRKGGVARWKARGTVTSDWSLFAAIQDLPLGAAPAEAFDFLEGLSLLRTSYRLAYRGTVSWAGGSLEGPLHHFEQWGHGTLPYGFWLDSRRRLLVAATLARAYILDDRAEEALRERRQGRLQRNKQRNQSRKNG